MININNTLMRVRKPRCKADDLAMVVLSLYKVGVPSDAMVARCYDRDAAFSNTLVQVRGLQNIQAHFRMLRAFIQSSEVILVRASILGWTELSIDSVRVYRLKPFPSWIQVTLRVHTVVTFEDAKIATHTDHIDFHSVAANIPVVSFVYNQFRALLGAASSFAARHLLAP